MEFRTFGENLIFFRETKGLKQKELAQLAGITPTALNYYEKNKREPNVLIIKTIAKILGITGDELLGITVDDNHDKDTSAQKDIPVTLSAAEKQLLQNFRQLSVAGQKYIVRQIDFALVQPDYKKQPASDRLSRKANVTANKKSEPLSSDFDGNGDP